MYATLPFYWNYAAAFTVGSVGGFSGILCDELADNVRKRQQVNDIHKFALSCLGGVGKVIQAFTAVAMLQAACLSLGCVSFGLANYKFVTIAVPVLIETFIFIVNQTNSNRSKQIVNHINAYFGCMSMTAALISALVITKKIGCFDLLPLAIVSTSAYLIYRVVKKSARTVPI